MAQRCLRFDGEERWCRQRYHTLQQREERAHLIACEETLKEVNQWDRYTNLVGPYWRRVFDHPTVSVKEYTYEFLSTFTFEDKKDPWNKNAIRYRINGKWEASSVGWFGVNLGIYSLEEYENDVLREGFIHRTLPDEEIDQKKAGAMRKAFWLQIGDGSRYSASSSKSSKIRDPLLRYIHRLLSHGITGRGKSEGVVNLRDLWILYCIVNRHPLDIAYLFAYLFDKNASADVTNPILCGSWIATLYEKYGIYHRNTTPGIGPAFLNLQICINMSMVAQLPDSGEHRFCDKDHQIWDPSDPNDVMMELEYNQQGHEGGGSGNRGGNGGGDGNPSTSQQQDFPTMRDLYDAIGRVEQHAQQAANFSSQTSTRMGQLSERVDTLAGDFNAYKAVWEARWEQDHPSP